MQSCELLGEGIFYYFIMRLLFIYLNQHLEIAFANTNYLIFSVVNILSYFQNKFYFYILLLHLIIQLNVNLISLIDFLFSNLLSFNHYLILFAMCLIYLNNHLEKSVDFKYHNRRHHQFKELLMIKEFINSCHCSLIIAEKISIILKFPNGDFLITF